MVETLRNGKKAAVLEALRQGCTRRAACRAVGIDPSTLWQWMQDDPTISNAVTKAEAEAEQYYVSKIRAAAEAPAHWTAAAWMLERRLPDDYGKRERLDVTSGDKPITPDAGAILAELERRGVIRRPEDDEPL